MPRDDKRKFNELRPVKITRNYLKHPQGSVLIEMGDTKVICSAFVDENLPQFRKGKKAGWVTAEYSMLPGATSSRSLRDHGQGRAKGRTHEIQRLVGRSLRSVVNMKLLGERTILLDADVIQADGGTRTASITGCFIALKDAVAWLLKKKKIKKDPITGYLAAVSVGIVDGKILLDLKYSEDVNADVDMNVVMTADGNLVEVQGTAEGAPFSEKQLVEMLALARGGIEHLIALQKEVVA